MSTTDQDLHDFAQQGSPEAFRRIVDRYVGAVHSAALRVLWQRQPLAEEVTQEVFVLLVRKASALPSSIELGGWLHRQAVRLSLNALRTERRRAAREATALELHTMNAPADESHRWAEVMPHVDAEMLKLSAADQQALALRFFDGRELSDIASALGISAGAVQKRIARALEALRVRLQRRGVALSATALGALMSAEFVQASLAPAAATIATQALAATTTATGTALISTLLAMKMKLALAVGAVLLVSAVGYDLASKDSRIARWFGSESAASATQTTPKNQQAERNAASDQPSAAERRLAEARDIWAKAPKIAPTLLTEVLTQMLLEPDQSKQLALLHSIGITISLGGYNNFMAGYPSGLVRLRDFGEIISLLKAWAKEAPREAVAWAQRYFDRPRNSVLWSALESASQIPEEWAAFLQAAPDPRVIHYTDVWLSEANDPGSSWATGAKIMTEGVLRERAGERIRSDPPEVALRALLRCPDERTRTRGLMGLSLKLSKGQMLSLAEHEFAGSASAANWLRAMAGDPSASFSQALDMTHGVIYTNRHEPFVQYFDDDRAWALAGAREVFAQWLAIDPVAATKRGTTEGEGFTASFMEAAVRSGKVNEAMIHEALASDPKERDRALAYWYQALSGDDPHAALQRILDSTVIDDEIEAAKPILDAWALKSPSEAAAWLKSLPASKDHGELAAEIANSWIKTEPEAAIAFALEQGMGLNTRHGIDTAATYLSKADPEATTTFLHHFQGDERYNELVMHAASWKFMSDPTIGVTKEKIQYIADHAQGDWQSAAVEFFGMFVPAGVPNVKPYETTLLSFDLTRQDPKRVASAATLLVKSYNGIGKVADGMNMTLQLPAAAAALTREGVASTIDISNPARRTALLNWIQSAAIGAPERTALLTTLNTRLKK